MKLLNNIVVPLLILCATSNGATTYFIATDGNDINDGSMNSPWQSFRFALQNLKAGDTLYVRGGTYLHQTLECNNSGNEAEGYITVSAYQNEKCILEGQMHTEIGVQIRAEYFVLNGFELRKWSNGIDLRAPANHVRISNCVVYDVVYGISLYNNVQNIDVNNCDIHHFGWYGFDATATDGVIENVRIQNCTSHDADYTIDNHNPDMNSDGFALGHGNQRNITFSNCNAYNVGDGFDLDGTAIVAMNCIAHSTHYGAGGGFKCWGDSISIINCLSYANKNTGIELDQATTGTFASAVTNTFIINCTVVDNLGTQIQVFDTLKHLTMYSTIVAGGPTGKLPDTTQHKGMMFEKADVDKTYFYTGDNNLFHSSNPYRYIATPEVDFGIVPISSKMIGEWSGTTRGQDARSEFLQNLDGLFLARERRDYRLAANSRAINNGNIERSSATDIVNVSRNNSPDIGCYEYNPLQHIHFEQSSFDESVVLFPNPAQEHVAITIPNSLRNGTITISNISGEQVFSHNVELGVFPDGVAQVDIKELTKGAYILRLTGDSFHSTKVLIIR